MIIQRLEPGILIFGTRVLLKCTAIQRVQSISCGFEHISGRARPCCIFSKTGTTTCRYFHPDDKTLCSSFLKYTAFGTRVLELYSVWCKCVSSLDRDPECTLDSRTAPRAKHLPLFLSHRPQFLCERIRKSLFKTILGLGFRF